MTELALYLVAGILLLVGIIALFGSDFTSTKTAKTISQMNAIIAAVHSSYSGESLYLGMNTASIANSGALASAWLVGTVPNATGIVSPFGGPVYVSDFSGNCFVIIYDYLPIQACIAVATEDQGTSFVSENINGTNLTTVPSVATATSLCNKLGSNNFGNNISLVLE